MYMAKIQCGCTCVPMWACTGYCTRTRRTTCVPLCIPVPGNLKLSQVSALFCVFPCNYLAHIVSTFQLHPPPLLYSIDTNHEFNGWTRTDGRSAGICHHNGCRHHRLYHRLVLDLLQKKRTSTIGFGGGFQCSHRSLLRWSQRHIHWFTTTTTIDGRGTATEKGYAAGVATVGGESGRTCCRNSIVQRQKKKKRQKQRPWQKEQKEKQ